MSSSNTFRTLGMLAAAPLMAALLVLVSSGSAHSASTVPSKFTDSLVAQVSNPTSMAIAPNDGRLFVAQKSGKLRVIKGGKLLSKPFLTVSTDTTYFRGLLGVTFDPNFSQNKYIYVFYTATTPYIHNRVSRFTANGDVAVAGSEKVLLDLPETTGSGHYGGSLRFGADGKLYVGVGDDTTHTDAQSLSTVNGKILRINSDGTIPSDNPFYSNASGDSRAIWALGLRQPYSLDVSSTGRMFVNEVGEDTWEEIDEVKEGTNYGWPTHEGYTASPDASLQNYANPLFYYAHTGDPATTGCSITGGAFYDPTTQVFPSEYSDDYFYTDYCSGWIRSYDPTTNTDTAFASGITKPVDLEVGENGRLYYLARGSSNVSAAVREINYTG